MAKQRVIPGYGLSMGVTITWLSLIILIPLAALFLKAAGLGPGEWWNILTSPRVIAAGKLTFGASAAAASVSVVLGLLVAVLFAPPLNATRRWLFVGGVSVQPSELAKVAVVLFLAYLIERRGET